MKRILIFSMLLLLFLVSACNDGGVEDSSVGITQEASDTPLYSEESNNLVNSLDEAESVGREESTAIRDQEMEAHRKVIYTGYVEVETDSYSKLISTFEAEIAKLGGYVVDSNMQRGNENDGVSGQVTIRVPEEEFDVFLEFIESESKVMERSVSGQDVTEEFVDLESRLTSKRAVEERLLEFMEQAEDTEGLLAISQDLANVQEEIETIVGRMNYLEDRTDLATITVHIYENKLRLSSINDDGLNTWEETKKQFMRSINYIVASFSSLVIYIVGNLPVIALVGIIILLIVFYIKRKSKKSSRQD